MTRLLDFVRHHPLKLAVFVLWLLALLLFWWFVRGQGLGAVTLVQVGLAAMTDPLTSALILTGLYLLRPLFLLPATPLIVMAGFAFGPVGGILYVLVIGTLSAVIGYLCGRYLMSSSVLQGLDRSFVGRLRRHSFETVLTGRLILLPGDLVNYSCGILGVGLLPFALATLLGSLPGSLAAVLFGASLEGELSGRPELNVWTLLLSLAVFAGSLFLARALRRRQPPPA